MARPLEAKVQVCRLSESDVTSIDASGTVPRGGSENIVENVFERKGFPAHLLKSFQDLGARDGAWARCANRSRQLIPSIALPRSKKC